MTSRIYQLRTDLAAAQSETVDCSALLEELRQQSAALQAGVDAAGTGSVEHGGRALASMAAATRCD